MTESKIISHADARAWSMLDPRPGCYYVRATDTYIVYWNGYATTRQAAMIIASMIFAGIFASPKVKDVAFASVELACHTNSFGEIDWSLRTFTPASYINYMCKRLAQHVLDSHLDNKIEKTTILTWFDPRNISGEI
jgi:hypothetical protein